MKKPNNRISLLYIIITKNNLKISIVDIKGRIIFKKTEGMLIGIRKGSINSADTSLLMMNTVANDILSLDVTSIGIYLRGATRWKKLSLRRLINKLKNSKVSIKFIRDITGVPHNGCSFSSKRRKRRRRRLKRKFFLKEYFISKSDKRASSISDLKIQRKALKRFKKSIKFLKYIKTLKKRTLRSKKLIFLKALQTEKSNG